MRARLAGVPILFVSLALVVSCASQADEFRKCVSAATQHEIGSSEADHIAASIAGNSASADHARDEHGAYYQLSPDNQRMVIEQCSAFLPEKGAHVTPGFVSEIVDPPKDAPSATECPAGMRHEGEGCVPIDARPGAMVKIPGAQMLYQNKHVDVATFEIDVMEVSVAAYKSCVDARACSLPYFQDEERRLLGRIGYSDHTNATTCHWADGAFDHPINCVDWTQASAYCKWAGKRLPTALEVIFAAIGQTGWHYPWGNDDPDPKDERVCPTYDHTCAVWTNPRGQSKFGVFHLADNVGEWLADPACETGKPCKGDAHHVIGGQITHPNGWQNLGSAKNEERGPQNGFRCAKTP